MVRRVLSWVAFFVAFSEAWRLAPWVQSTILPLLDLKSGALAGLVVLVLSFVLLYLLLCLLVRLLSSIFEGGVLGLVNRFLGAILSLALVIYVMGYAFVLADKAMPPSGDDVRLKSEMYAPIKNSTADFARIKRYWSELW